MIYRAKRTFGWVNEGDFLIRTEIDKLEVIRGMVTVQAPVIDTSILEETNLTMDEVLLILAL